MHFDSQRVRDSNVQLMEDHMKNGNHNIISEMDEPCGSPAVESYRSMGELLSNPEHPSPLSGNGSGAGKEMTKVMGSSHNTKRLNFWGRSNVS